jgi:hemerythrin-like domain-containing protein
MLAHMSESSPLPGRPAPAAGAWPDEASERPLVDVRDMIVVHTALLREFRLAPAAVSRVADGSHRQSAAVDRHLGLLCDLLHHHHAGEDKLLWPLLRSRIPPEALTLLEAAEAEHSGIDQARSRVVAARRAWTERPERSDREVLIETLQILQERLSLHLDAEERALLPLAAAHLTGQEWAAIGAAGAGAMPKSAMALVFGMFAYEGDPEVLAQMLHSAPALPRLLIPRIAPRAYARRAALIYGTTRP